MPMAIEIGEALVVARSSLPSLGVLAHIDRLGSAAAYRAGGWSRERDAADELRRAGDAMWEECRWDALRPHHAAGLAPAGRAAVGK